MGYHTNVSIAQEIEYMNITKAIIVLFFVWIKGDRAVTLNYGELGFHGHSTEKLSNCLMVGHSTRIQCSAIRRFLQSDKLGIWGPGELNSLAQTDNNPIVLLDKNGYMPTKEVETTHESRSLNEIQQRIDATFAQMKKIQERANTTLGNVTFAQVKKIYKRTNATPGNVTLAEVKKIYKRTNATLQKIQQEAIPNATREKTAWDVIKEKTAAAWDATRRNAAEGWDATRRNAAEGWDATRRNAAAVWDITRRNAAKGWNAIGNPISMAFIVASVKTGANLEAIQKDNHPFIGTPEEMILGIAIVTAGSVAFLRYQEGQSIKPSITTGVVSVGGFMLGKIAGFDWIFPGREFFI